MYYAIEALTYLFDMVIIIIYMNGIFHKENRQTYRYPLYIACFLIMEVLIYVNQALCTGLPSKQFTIATSTVSLLTTFARPSYTGRACQTAYLYPFPSRFLLCLEKAFSCFW